jgi:fibronectin type 3 domain-containing protein
LVSLGNVNVTKTIGHTTGNILYWDAVENAVFYQVYRLSADKSTWELITNTASTGYKDTTAPEGVKSYYKIVARNGNVIGSIAGATSVGIVRPLSITKLDDVTGLKATAHKSGNILSWNAVEGAKLYQVYRLSADKTTWELLKNTGSLAYKDETAQVNVRHYYKVIARNGDIKSSMNIASVSAVRPANITKLEDVTMKSAAGHKTGIIVSWNAVENALLYQVYRRAADETSWTLITNTGSLAYKDTTAEVGVKYYYKVVARNGDIKSSLNIAAVSAIRPE